MIIVKLGYRNDDIVSVEVKGHAGYAKYGKDIVCSAVSAIVQTALMGIEDVSEVNVEYVKGDSGYLSFKVPIPQSVEEGLKQQAILRAMALGVADLEKGYKPYVKTEVNKICL